MKILVTGGAGYIGSVFTEHLCDHGHNVLVVDNLSEGHQAAVDPRAQLEVVDLNETARLGDLMKAHGSEAVVHFAANALVGESMKNPAKYYGNNVTGGLSLLNAMVTAGVPKIVFSSTCATYGIPDSLPITESTIQRPVNPYGHSKLTFEGMLRWYGEIHGIEPVIFRYFNAAGASPRFGEHHRVETHLIPNILFAAQGRQGEIKIFGDDYDTPDGTAIRDYIHVLDLASAHRIAVETSITGQFNLGTGCGHSVKEVIEACRSVTGREIITETCPRRAGDPPRLVASIDKARSVLGWEPRFTDIAETIKTAWNWHEANPKGYADIIEQLTPDQPSSSKAA